jgi:hypothetical protein
MILLIILGTSIMACIFFICLSHKPSPKLLEELNLTLQSINSAHKDIIEIYSETAKGLKRTTDLFASRISDYEWRISQMENLLNQYKNSMNTLQESVIKYLETQEAKEDK